jgi:hypothetical protein
MRRLDEVGDSEEVIAENSSRPLCFPVYPTKLTANNIRR